MLTKFPLEIIEHQASMYLLFHQLFQTVQFKPTDTFTQEYPINYLFDGYIVVPTDNIGVAGRSRFAAATVLIAISKHTFY